MRKTSAACLIALLAAGVGCRAGLTRTPGAKDAWKATAEEAGVLAPHLLTRYALASGVLLVVTGIQGSGVERRVCAVLEPATGRAAPAVCLEGPTKAEPETKATAAPFLGTRDLVLVDVSIERRSGTGGVRGSAWHHVLRAGGAGLELACVLPMDTWSRTGTECGFQGTQRTKVRAMPSAPDLSFEVAMSQHGYDTCKPGMPSHHTKKWQYTLTATGKCTSKALR